MTIYKIGDNDKIPPVSPKVPIIYQIISNDEDLKKYIGFPEIKKNFWKFEDFLNGGSRLYLAFVAENLAGYYIVTNLNKYKPYLCNHHPLFSHGINHFIFYCRTFEKYRNNRIYSFMLTQICKESISDGESVLISTDLDNKFSQKGIENAGFEKIGTLKHIQLFNIVFFSKFVGVDEIGKS